jgi:acyl-CoA thioester hydrolase
MARRISSRASSVKRRAASLRDAARGLSSPDPSTRRSRRRSETASPMTTTEAPGQDLDLRVYYEDTDFSGRVYHASYLRFMERGRTEWLRALGFEHGALSGEQGLVFAVRGLQIEYLVSAVMDDLLRVETRLAGIRGAVIEFAQLILRRSERIAEAKVRVVALKNGRATRIPRELRARLDAAR